MPEWFNSLLTASPVTLGLLVLLMAVAGPLGLVYVIILFVQHHKTPEVPPNVERLRADLLSQCKRLEAVSAGIESRLRTVETRLGTERLERLYERSHDMNNVLHEVQSRVQKLEGAKLTMAEVALRLDRAELDLRKNQDETAELIERFTRLEAESSRPAPEHALEAIFKTLMEGQSAIQTALIEVLRELRKAGG